VDAPELPVGAMIINRRSCDVEALRLKRRRHGMVTIPR